MGHSAYMTLTDTGLPTDSFLDKGHQVTSHPTTDTGHEAHFHADTPDQVKSFPELMKYPGKSYDYTGQPATSFPNTGLLAPIHLDTDYQITPQLPAPSANTGNLTTSYPFVLSNTNSLTAPKTATGASTPVTSALYQVLLTPIRCHAPAVTTSPKPIHPSAYNLRPHPDPFTPESSPATSYHEIKPSPYVQVHNHAPPNSGSVFQIAEALAKVTQLQRLLQAKPDVFTGNESDTKFFIWEIAFDTLIELAPISAQQKMCLLYQHLDGNAKKVIEQL